MVALVYLGQVLPVGEGGSVLGGCVRGGVMSGHPIVLRKWLNTYSQQIQACLTLVNL